MITKRSFLVALALMGALGSSAALVRAQPAQPVPDDPGLPHLEQEILRLAQMEAGTVGVGVIHLETGRSTYLNGDEPFPMASTYKVPIAVQLLTRVDRREVSLDRMLELDPEDLRPGSGTLTELFDDPGVILSLRNLLELMLLISDNSATDLVLKEAGGAAAVTRRMQELGLGGIRVDRPTVRLIGDFLGVKNLPPDNQVSSQGFRQLAQVVTGAEREQAGLAFNADPKDTATPQAMVELLAHLWYRKALSDESSALLLDIMGRCRTGAGRLRGLLTPDTEVFHKTGTIGATTNDVGILRLPNGAGHVAIAVFVKDSTAEVPRRERVIAHIARAVHDYFLFRPLTGTAPTPGPRPQ